MSNDNEITQEKIDEILDSLPPVERLSNPDTEEHKSAYDFNDDMLYRILGAMIYEEGFGQQCLRLVKPDYFRRDEAKLICRLIQTHINTYGVVPDSVALHNQLIEKIKDPGDCAMYRGYLDAVCEYEVGVIRRAEIMDSIKQFAFRQNLRATCTRSLDVLGGKIPQSELKRDYGTADTKQAVLAMLKRFEEDATCATQTIKPLKPFSSDWLLRENDDWLVEDFLQQGHLMVLAARAKAGKSLFSSWLATRLLYDDTFLGGAISGERPIIYLDYEQPFAYFHRWLSTFVGNDDKRLADAHLHCFSRSSTENQEGYLPNYLTLDWIKECVAGIAKADTWKKPGLIVVDTFRGAFQSMPGLQADFENSADSIGRILRPLTNFCHETRWSMIVVHHCNKQGIASGSTEFAAASDTVCRFDRAVGGNVCEIMLDGRLFVQAEKKIMTFDADHGFNFEGNARDFEESKSKRKEYDDYVLSAGHILNVLPEGTEFAISDIKAELQGIVGEKRIHTTLRRMVDDQVLIKTGGGRSVRYRKVENALARLQITA
jgi:hypothetical protein